MKRIRSDRKTTHITGNVVSIGSYTVNGITHHFVKVHINKRTFVEVYVNNTNSIKLNTLVRLRIKNIKRKKHGYYVAVLCYY